MRSHTAQFTLLADLRDWLTFYGCFSTAMFGAAYFIVPRLTGHAWRSSALIAAHVGATGLGLLLITVTLGWAGWEQGKMLNDAGVAFTDITKALTPWFTAHTVGLMILAVGHLAFFVNFFWSLPARCPLTGDAATAIFPAPPAMEGPKA
jgi:cytochrome c oxidase cbb3-type subunit 1